MSDDKMKSHAFNIRVDGETKSSLEKISVRNGRTLTSEIRLAITNHIAKFKNAKAS